MVPSTLWLNPRCFTMTSSTRCTPNKKCHPFDSHSPRCFLAQYPFCAVRWGAFKAPWPVWSRDMLFLEYDGEVVSIVLVFLNALSARAGPLHCLPHCACVCSATACRTVHSCKLRCLWSWTTAQAWKSPTSLCVASCSLPATCGARSTPRQCL